MFDLLSPPLVGLIGFAASRASLCTVRAVAEVLTSQRAWLLTSFAKAAAWTTVVSGVIALVSPTSATQVLERLPHGLGLVGGFLFGVGAAINGGCSLSTLQRLADGDLSMLGTLTAYILSVKETGLRASACLTNEGHLEENSGGQAVAEFRKPCLTRALIQRGALR